MQNAKKRKIFWEDGACPKPLAEYALWRYICYWTATRRILAETMIHCMPRIKFVRAKKKYNLCFPKHQNKKAMQPHFRQKHLNVSDTWLCFARSIILADKQNNLVKMFETCSRHSDCSECQHYDCGSRISLPLSPRKKEFVQRTWPRKQFLQRRWTWQKIHAWS